MQFPSRYALLVVGPLSLWNVGCAAVTHRPVASAGREISTTDRLIGMAQVYEQKGQLEQAHKLYCQVLQSEPNHQVAREHANDLVAAMANAQAAKDPANQKAEMAATAAINSRVDVASVQPKPTDPALLGRGNRKLLNDDEVAARIPKPRAAQTAEPAASVATVRHESTTRPTVVPAEQIAEKPATIPVVVLEEPLTVVEAPQPIAAPMATQIPAVESVTTVVELPVISSNRATTTIKSPGSGSWGKTPVARLCPDAPSHFSGMLQSLDAADPEARKLALEDLANCGRDAQCCVPAIKACLSDSDPVVQGHAAWALWTITGDSAEPLRCLRAVLRCDQEEAVVFACYVLGQMGADAKSATSELATLQNDDSTAIRVHASEAMLKISHDGGVAIRVLTATLSSHKADDRSLAAVALGAACGNHRKSAISSLITALYDSDATVRCSAALALGGFGSDAQPAISALEVAAAATDPETRDAATTALACIRK